MKKNLKDYRKYCEEISKNACPYCFKAKLIRGEAYDGYCEFCKETGEISEELAEAYIPHSGSQV